MSDERETVGPGPGVAGPVPAAERLAVTLESRGATRPSLAASILHDIAKVDLAVYEAVAATPTPSLDVPLRRLTGWANHSKVWLLIAAGLFALGGREGRRAALTGAVAIGVNSAVVNLLAKLASGRARPDREAAAVPYQRRVPMPTSTSFPSGHSASGFAFADAVAATMPAVAVPLRGLAAAVAYSRVHAGVHYPGDVVAGALVGATIGETTGSFARALIRRRRSRGAADRARSVSSGSRPAAPRRVDRSTSGTHV